MFCEVHILKALDKRLFLTGNETNIFYLSASVRKRGGCNTNFKTRNRYMYRDVGTAYDLRSLYNESCVNVRNWFEQFFVRIRDGLTVSKLGEKRISTFPGTDVCKPAERASAFGNTFDENVFGWLSAAGIGLYRLSANDSGESLRSCDRTSRRFMCRDDGKERAARTNNKKQILLKNASAGSVGPTRFLLVDIVS